MQKDQISNLLTETDFFGSLPPDAMNNVIAAGRLREVAKGQQLFSTGDEGDAVFAVLKGRILLSRLTSDGKEIALTAMERGDLFGELSLIDGEPRSTDAIVAEAALLFVLERQAFWRLMREQSDIGEKLLVMMCQRLRATNQLVESTSFLELGPRLARLLLILAARSDTDSDGAVILQSRYTQGELAKRIAASRESVSKQIAQWSREGILHIDKGKLRIVDLEAITQLADTLDPDW